jgi:hypothetical protein
MLLSAALSTTLWAVEKQFENGTIVAIQQKSDTQVLLYLVNTPITREEPYYELSVRVRSTVYFGQYTPKDENSLLSQDWHANAPVQARLDRRHLLLKGPGGREIKMAIIRSKKQAQELPSQAAEAP